LSNRARDSHDSHQQDVRITRENKVKQLRYATATSILFALASSVLGSVMLRTPFLN
jgi:hypothetical protein